MPKTVIGGDQNILGITMPTVYIDGVDYQLPIASQGGRQETFEKDIKEWIDLDNVIHERIRGYRLKAEWEWEQLTAVEINDLIEIYNAAKRTTDVRLKFSTFPRRYLIRITDFEHELSDGRGFRSAASMEVEGTRLLDAFPNPDLFYTMPPNLGYGCIVRTLIEQGNYKPPVEP